MPASPRGSGTMAAGSSISIRPTPKGRPIHAWAEIAATAVRGAARAAARETTASGHRTMLRPRIGMFPFGKWFRPMRFELLPRRERIAPVSVGWLLATTRLSCRFACVRARTLPEFSRNFHPGVILGGVTHCMLPANMRKRPRDGRKSRGRRVGRSKEHAHPVAEVIERPILNSPFRTIFRIDHRFGKDHGEVGIAREVDVLRPLGQVFRHPPRPPRERDQLGRQARCCRDSECDDAARHAAIAPSAGHCCGE